MYRDNIIVYSVKHLRRQRYTEPLGTLFFDIL